MSSVVHPCPAPGQGVHLWMYGATHALKRGGVPAHEVESILRPLMTRRAQPREIANTIETVYAMPLESSSSGRAEPTRSVIDAAKMGEIQQRYRSVTLQTWEELTDPCDDQEEILRWAFKPGEFICMGNAGWTFNTAPLEAAIKHARGWSFIVPNPFRSRWGRTKAGKLSKKSESQVLERRFIVVEFDLRAFDWTTGFTRAAKLDYQARLHYHLSREFPLALVVFSGNESAHGWYATKRPSCLMTEAVSIGADPALRVRSQFTRMPHGIHANGAVQRVVYFNPSNFRHHK